MPRISSSFQRAKIRYLPGIILVFCVLQMGMILYLGGPVVSATTLIPLLLGALLVPLLVLGFLRWLYGQVVDEVWDEGQFLRIRKGDAELRIPLSDILDIEVNRRLKPLTATLCLRRASPLGQRIVFLPDVPLTWARHPAVPAVDDLLRRLGR